MTMKIYIQLYCIDILTKIIKVSINKVHKDIYTNHCYERIIKNTNNIDVEKTGFWEGEILKK